MSDADAPPDASLDASPDASLAAGFEPPSREAWLKLVDKVLKGADFDKRLVARSADGLAMPPLATRADAVAAVPVAKKPSYFQGGWDIRQRHAEPDAKLANAAILEDLQGGATSLLLQIKAPGQAGISYRAKPLGIALKGVFLTGCTIALDARENTMDAAGSLLEIWREAGIGEALDPASVLSQVDHKARAQISQMNSRREHTARRRHREPAAWPPICRGRPTW